MPNPRTVTLAELTAGNQNLPKGSQARIGVVTAVQKTGNSWTLDMKVGGSTSTRRARWNGSGGQPKVGERVCYIDQSPIPVVLGRMAGQTEEQNFGNGTVTAGGFTDSTGPIRPAITTAHSTAVTGVNNAATAQGTANTGVNNAAAAQSAANSAQNAANNAQNSANAAYSRADAAYARADSAHAYTANVERSLVEAYKRIDFLNNRINQVEAYAVSLENTMVSFLGPGGPDD